MYSPGDIVITPFTNTDLREGKNRPVLLLAPLPNYADDWLACMITSQTRQFTDGLDLKILEGNSSFKQSGLKTTSVIRVTRLMALNEETMTGRIGSLPQEWLSQAFSNLVRWLSEQNK